MIISVLSGKGGVGKTTISALTALILDAAGLRIKVVDKDPQSSMRLTLARLGREDLLDTENPDITIIDTPPRLMHQVNEAINEADRIIIVSSPRRLDLDTTNDTIKMIQEAGRENDSVVLFNMVRKGTYRRKGEKKPRGSREEQLIDLLREKYPVDIVPQCIYNRTDFNNIHEYGLEALREDSFKEANAAITYSINKPTKK